MAFYDVIFPLKLGPLTYSGPSGLAPGMLLSAEIKKTQTRGILLGPAKEAPHGKIKEISSVIGDKPILHKPMLSLISWMADYYFTKEGIILKEVFPHDFLQKTDGPFFEAGSPALGYEGSVPPDAVIRTISGNMEKNYYKTFLLHAPSTGYQTDLLMELIRGRGNILILCPEIAYAKYVSDALSKEAGDRLSVMHSGMTISRRRKAMERALRGESDIVIGSRSALFAPLKGVSLIAVLNEESASYKKENGVMYNVRDMAVMRGYLEGATVLLSSICPSVESYYNAKGGKYTPLKPDVQAKRPKVRLIDMRSSKKTSPSISKTLFDKTAFNLRNGKKAAFLINRKGYSILECEECGNVEACENCGIPLVFYKDRTLRCHYCGIKKEAEGACTRCRSVKMKMPGAGIERVEEEIRGLFNMETLRLEGKKPDIHLIEAGGQVVIGTKIIARRPELKERFSLIAVLNADSYLQMPDFRSAEKAFQEFLYLTERASPDGEILIQGRSLRYPLFKYMKNYGFEGFYEEELKSRHELMYPPFSKTALITWQGDAATLPEIKDIDILGPVSAPGKKGGKLWKALIKANSREGLHKGIRALLRKLPGSPSVDVDPVSF
ncbi:MAG: primosomal protein N' [Thermodesulfovibrionales bacterium]|nr:primosomal protein N' [Thermodesulfovibrionales bacterium]